MLATTMETGISQLIFPTEKNKIQNQFWNFLWKVSFYRGNWHFTGNFPKWENTSWQGNFRCSQFLHSKILHLWSWSHLSKISTYNYHFNSHLNFHFQLSRSGNFFKEKFLLGEQFYFCLIESGNLKVESVSENFRIVAETL